MRAKIEMALVGVLALGLVVGITWAQSVPQLINYQGRLTGPAGQPLADGSTVDLTFTFYGAESGATPLYLTILQENVVVTGGIYNVFIGSGAVTAGTEDTVANTFQNHQNVWMGVKVDAENEMTPRTRMTSVPYALKAQTVDLAAFYSQVAANPDLDNDGYKSTLVSGPDCNDGDPAINPGTAEICDDGLDNDCDGNIDNSDYDCPTYGTVLIPAGCYEMGDVQSVGSGDERPPHNVCITSDFYMARHETTNKEYKLCVDTGACTAPAALSSATRSSYYGNPLYDNFPVIHVTWGQANTYCAWAGRRLPSEAEWEYAARGGLSGAIYAWGDTISGSRANYLNSGDPWDNDTSPAEYYPPNGYGLYDVAGNVWEWVNDWYSSGYYQYCVDNNVVNDPPGPVGSSFRALRSSAWEHAQSTMRVSERDYGTLTDQAARVGFRCAGD